MSMNVALVQKGDQTAEIFNDAANIELWKKDGWNLVVPKTVVPAIEGAAITVTLPTPVVSPEVKLDSPITPPVVKKEEATSAPKKKKG